jgi:paraquat-inducible protein A
MTVLFACRDCGQIHRVPTPPLTNRWLLCRRCGRRLWRSPRRGLDRPFAYATGAIVLFLIANGFTLFEIGFAGDHRSGLIISGAVQLTRYDAGVAGVGALVALISIILPALTLSLVFAVLARLVVTHRDNKRCRPAIAVAWKLARHLRP